MTTIYVVSDYNDLEPPVTYHLVPVPGICHD